MATIMPASELVRRAAAWLAEQRALYPEKSLAALLDEAGMRFNLNPLDAAALGRLFDPATPVSYTHLSLIYPINSSSG